MFIYIYGVKSVYLVSITKSSMSNNTFLLSFFANLIASLTLSDHGHVKIFGSNFN